MFANHSNTGYQEVVDGIYMKPLVHGDRTLLTEIKCKKGSILDFHEHHHEQTGYLIEGRFELTVGDETHRVEPGDSWCINGSKQHRAEFLEESLVIEVFSPPREDYMS